MLNETFSVIFKHREVSVSWVMEERLQVIIFSDTFFPCWRSSIIGLNSKMECKHPWIWEKKLKVEFCATTPRWNFWSNAKIWAWVYSVTQMPIKSILGVPSLEFALSNLCFAKKRGQFMCVAVFSNFKHSVFFYEKINHFQKCERSELIFFLARKFKCFILIAKTQKWVLDRYHVFIKAKIVFTRRIFL